MHDSANTTNKLTAFGAPDSKSSSSGGALTADDNGTAPVDAGNKQNTFVREVMTPSMMTAQQSTFEYAPTLALSSLATPQTSAAMCAPILMMKSANCSEIKSQCMGKNITIC